MKRSTLNWLQDLAAGTASGFLALSAYLLFLMMMLIVVNVSGRYFNGLSIPGSAGISRALLVCSIGLALPYVTFANKHIKIDLLQSGYESRIERIRLFVIEIISCLAFATLSWFVFDLGRQAIRYDDVIGYLQIPLGPVAFVLAAMLALCTLLFLLKAIQTVGLALPYISDPRDRGTDHD